MKKKTGKRISSLGLCLLLVLAGCSGKQTVSENAPAVEATHTAPVHTPSREETPAPEEPTVAAPEPEKPKGYQAGGGPVFIRNSRITNTSSFSGDTGFIDAFKLYQLDLNTLEFTEIFSCDGLPKGYTTAVSLNVSAITTHTMIGNSWTQEQVFSPDFSRMAISWINSNDNSSHVGWIDNSGQITDVTSKVSGTASDFAKAPRHAYATFTPNGYFAYVDQIAKTINVVDISSLTVLSTTESECHFWVDPSHPVVRKEIDYLQSDNYFAQNVCEGTAAGTFVNDYFFDYAVYAGNDAVLKYGDRSIQKETADNSIGLTPDTDFDIYNVTYKDGKILFTAARGADEYYLFEMDDANGVGNPRKIMELPLERQKDSQNKDRGFYAYRMLFWK